MSINRVNISGNLTADPERRETASGGVLLNFSIAVNDRRKDAASGEWISAANYVDCVLFGNRVDYCAKVLSKGTHVAIDGKLRWVSWEQKDGTKRSKLEVVVNDIDLYGLKADDTEYSDEEISF